MPEQKKPKQDKKLSLYPLQFEMEVVSNLHPNTFGPKVRTRRLDPAFSFDPLAY